MEELEKLVLQWATDRKILVHSTPQIQGLKLGSEMGELFDNLAKGRDVKDDIGDCIVVLSLIANMSGTSLAECYQVAYDDIKDRKGQMNELGVFIKDGDVENQPIENEPTLCHIFIQDDISGFGRAIAKLVFDGQEVIRMYSDTFNYSRFESLNAQVKGRPLSYVTHVLKNEGFEDE